jgi:hypothetical protein
MVHPVYSEWDFMNEMNETIFREANFVFSLLILPICPYPLALSPLLITTLTHFSSQPSFRPLPSLQPSPQFHMVVSF